MQKELILDEMTNEELLHEFHVNGRTDLKDYLVERNLRLIHHVAKKYTLRARELGFDYDDVYSMGAIGLLKSIEKFDVNFGVKFTTYSVPMIQGEIQRYFRDQNYGGVRYSRTSKEIAHHIGKNKWFELENEEIVKLFAESDINFSQLKDGKPNLEQIVMAKEFITTKKVDSTDKIIYENDGDPITIGDQLSTQEDYSSIFIDDYLSLLNEKEKLVVLMRMDGAIQSEIAEKAGVSQVQVSRLLKSIGNKVKNIMKRNGEEMGKKMIATEDVYYLREVLDVPVKGIVDILGVSDVNIYRHLKKAEKMHSIVNPKDTVKLRNKANAWKEKMAKEKEAKKKEKAENRKTIIKAYNEANIPPEIPSLHKNNAVEMPENIFDVPEEFVPSEESAPEIGEVRQFDGPNDAIGRLALKEDIKFVVEELIKEEEKQMEVGPNIYEEGPVKNYEGEKITDPSYGEVSPREITFSSATDIRGSKEEIYNYLCNMANLVKSLPGEEIDLKLDVKSFNKGA